MELHFLGKKRLGVANRITYGFSKSALYNWFDMKKVDSDHTRVKVPGLKKWIVDTKYKQKAILWNAHKRLYGIGMRVNFWTNHDDLTTPAPRNKPPRDFQVLSPLYLAPINAWETRFLSYDEEIWKFQGGNLKQTGIHQSRISILSGPDNEDEWRPLSVIEPTYLAIICYYNALIYLTRAMAKLGNMAPVFHTPGPSPNKKEVTDFIEMYEEMVMNGVFIVGRDDKVDFQTTNIGQGLYQICEILKEEISGSTQIPLNALFGRSDSGGLGNGGALTAERQLLQNYANEQVDVSDEFMRDFINYGFDVEGLEPDWNLALQKTREQELAEEAMQIQNDMAREQLKLMKKQNKMMGLQQELFEQNKDSLSPIEQLDEQEQIKEDFNYVQSQREAYFNMMRALRLAKLQGEHTE